MTDTASDVDALNAWKKKNQCRVTSDLIKDAQKKSDQTLTREGGGVERKTCPCSWRTSRTTLMMVLQLSSSAMYDLLHRALSGSSGKSLSARANQPRWRKRSDSFCACKGALQFSSKGQPV